MCWLPQPKSGLSDRDTSLATHSQIQLQPSCLPIFAVLSHITKSVLTRICFLTVLVSFGNLEEFPSWTGLQLQSWTFLLAPVRRCVPPPRRCCAAFRGCGVQSTSLGVQELVLDPRQQPWPLQQHSWTVPCRGDCVDLLFVCPSALVLLVWGDTACRKLLVLGCFSCWFGFCSWLDSEQHWMSGRIYAAGKAVWCCRVLELGKSGRALWVGGQGLAVLLKEAWRGRGEEAVTGTVLLAELMYFELLP